MLRGVVGVIIGYLVMFALVFSSLAAAYFVLGADGAFEAGTYEVTTAWIATSFVLSFIASVLGGSTCRAISRGPKAPVALAAVIVLAGLLMALPHLGGPESEPPKARGPEVGNLEAMQNARQPGWVALANPFLGAAGVLLGGRRARPKQPESSAP